jgi:hypothetical protein
VGIGATAATLIVIAAVAASIYAVWKAINHIATLGERARTKTAVLADSSGALKEWSERVLKGHFVVKGGDLVWKPRIGIETIPSISDLVKDWGRTEAAQATQKQRQDVLKTQTELAKTSQRLAYEARLNASNEITGIGRTAQRAGRQLNAAEKDRVEALEYLMRQQTGIFDTAKAAVDNYDKRLRGIERKFEPIIIQARIGDMKDTIKTAEGQLKGIRERLKKAKIGSDLYFRLQLNEQELLDKIALLDGRIKQLKRENKEILLDFRIKNLEKNVKTAQNLVNRLKARDIKNKVEFQVDTRQAMINLKTLQVRAAKAAGTYEGKVTVVAKLSGGGGNLGKGKNPLKGFGIPNWVTAGGTKSAQIAIDADPSPALEAVKTVKAALTTVAGLNPTPVISADPSGVYSGVSSANTSLNGIDGKTVTTYINTVRRPVKAALGGIFNVNTATPLLIGEAGPEVAAVFPLNDPATSAALLAQLNAQLGGSRGAPKNVVIGPIFTRGSSASTTRPVEIHHHYSSTVSLPGGVVVSDIDRFGRQVEPYVSRGQDLAIRRRERGRG